MLLVLVEIKALHSWSCMQAVACAGARSMGYCMWLPALWCHHRQILAAHSCFFQQLVFWGPTNVPAPLLLGCARGTAPVPHFPPQAKDKLKPQAFTAAQLYVERRAVGWYGGFLCTCLGFSGTCEGPKTQMKVLLCHVSLLGFLRSS